MKTNLLDEIKTPIDLKPLNQKKLEELAKELRCEILEIVSKTGGHLSSNLGTIELTLALHYVFNTPHDRIVWDVGHQSYPHKILTGRREFMKNLRQFGGISGFPRRSESEYDSFGTAHSSTSISAALGMAVASRNKNINRWHIAVIGDGAMSAGMAFEAMNNSSILSNINLLVILNDNDMSISPAVGALNRYLAKLMSGKFYAKAKIFSNNIFKNTPILEFTKRFKEHAKGMFTPATLFEELGFNYIGPICGHDFNALLPTLKNIKNLSGVQFLHIVTKKGQGYKLAEADPILYHGPGKFDLKIGIEKKTLNSKQTFTDVFSCWICDMANQDERLIAITPAMREGSGLVEFQQNFPDRYFDVGIAEQHAVTFAAGMACEGLKPIVAIYSTFLQRGYDQVIHDVALQNLDVTFALDRAGLVGADGPTHAGNYDIAFLRCIPNMVIATPSCENETRLLLSTCFNYQGPAAVRYPRGTGNGDSVFCELNVLELGKGSIIREGKKIAIVGFGTLVKTAIMVADSFDLTVANMRFVKPIDKKLILKLAKNHKAIVTLEDSAIMGGAGTAVTEVLNQENINIPILQLGIPDKFIEHGDRQELMKNIGLDQEGIELSIKNRFPDLLI
ncbi:MAG: 1-deoxy-D-xylulose-5-phosphate synthase [Bordetella sp.]|nr:MAG: 1-deoxy-D-xylulose-5-phosphate synthase [Bordetella sp.]